MHERPDEPTRRPAAGPGGVPHDATDDGGFDLDPASPLVRGAVEDLAARVGVDADAVTVVSARAVTWPDSSLGCPQPGMRYLPRVVDGSLVELEVAGARYRYTGGSPLRLCERW